MCITCSECVADVYVGVKTHLCNIHTRPCTSAQNICKVHSTLTEKKIHIYIYLHTYVYACIYTRKHMRMHDTVHTLNHWLGYHAHNLFANIYTHTHTHVYKRIDVRIHTHMHIYTYIMSAHIHTHIYLHTRIQNVHMNARKARLKRRCGSDCAGSPTWHQEALPFSLSASRQRAIQTTSAYLHWCGADPPSTPAPSLAVAPRNEVIFLPFWRGFLRVYMYMKSYKHTKQVGLRPLASSPLVFLQTVSRVRALEMWRGCLQVRRSRGTSSLHHHLPSHTLRRQLVAPPPVDGCVYIHTNR